MEWQAIGPSFAARRPLAELRAAYKRTDIIALDLDECIFPGFSQTELGARIAGRVLRRPVRRRDRRFLPQLALGACYFALKETKRFFGIGTPMRRLIARYERVMRGIPDHYVAESARSIPPDSYAFAAETVALLAEQAPTGIISLGLDVVVRAYVEQFQAEGRPALSFSDSNIVLFRTARDGSRVFDRYDPDALLLDGTDKLRALERRMAQFGARVPATVGHSDDDVPLARFCRDHRGLAIGFNPPLRLAKHFDVVARARDWEPLYALAAILAGPPKRKDE